MENLHCDARCKLFEGVLEEACRFAAVKGNRSRAQWAPMTIEETCFHRVPRFVFRGPRRNI